MPPVLPEKKQVLIVDDEPNLRKIPRCPTLA